MSLYTTYDLPAPPPPTSYSHDRGNPLRAALPPLLALFPDDAAAQAQGLRAFTRRRIYLDFSATAGFFTQLKVCAALICALLAVVALIIARRLRERSFWILRFAQKRNGIVVIPNAITCFTLMEGIYGVLIVAL